MIAKYFTAAQIASVLDVPVERVWEWKRAKLIAPVLTLGEEQYRRADILKLALMLALKDIFGDKHGAPSRLAAAHSDELSAISATLDDPGVAVPADLTVTLKPTPDSELRVAIRAALREKIAAVPA